MEIPLLKDIVIIFSLSIAVLLICHRLRLPMIVGFLLTGILSGPHGLQLVKVVAEVETLAKIGIVLLLFTVGMEYSLKKILQFKRFFLGSGALQVGLTTFVGCAVALSLGRPPGEAIFLGFLLSLSSTAIVLRILEDKNQTVSPHGRMSLGILIFQDMIVVPMMLVTPLLAGVHVQLDAALLQLLLKGIFILAIVFYSAMKLVPKLMDLIAKTRSRELFILSVLTICFATAGFVANMGLSLAMGAFLAGLMVSESEYSHQAIGDVLPFQDIFTSFFFLSIGMLLDIHFLLAHPFLVSSITLGVMSLKMATGTFAGIAVGMPLRTSLLAGIGIAQVGEFSFVLLKMGLTYGIGSDFYFQLFLAVSLLSMALTPILSEFSPRIGDFVLHLPLPPKLITGLNPLKIAPTKEVQNHTLIIGFGHVGKNIARSCREAAIPYLILEMNAQTVEKEKQRGEPIHFGDATHDAVLRHARIKEAHTLVVAINDKMATMRIIEKARRLNPSLYIIARTHYFEEMPTLIQIGADDVIPDDFGTSVEILTRVLRRYHTPADAIERQISDLRTEGYEMLRFMYKEPYSVVDMRHNLREMGVETVRLPAMSPYVGQTIQECGWRKKYGVTIAMIQRPDRTITDIQPNLTLEAHDRLVMIGPYEKLQTFLQEFSG